MAEQLLPRLKTAEWRDRAEAAAKMADEISLRDLRSVVAGADAAARDDETRLLASTLRDALESRLRQQRDAWLAEIGAALEQKRGRLRFRPLLAKCETRTEIVVLFMALLEMIKSGHLWAEQERAFGDIVLVEAVKTPA